MLSVIHGYVRVVDGFNRRLGRFAMYLLFLMMAVLLYSSFSKTFSVPSLWTLEMAQFSLVAYYMIGGPYSLQMGSNVRMDLFYGAWSDRTKAIFDASTAIFLLFYLGVLLYGGVSSATYALEYGERSYSSWRPYMSVIKIIMCFGISCMILQAISEFFKDIARIVGRPCPMSLGQKEGSS